MAVKQILGKVTVTPKGEYSSGETYKRLDIVTSNGQSYIAKVDNTGVSVTDTNTWLQLVEKPEKGIDYFTEEDIAQLVSMVTDDSESEFNEYYNGKVSDFNSNASSKTSEFNSNYDEKVESFNTIFDTSTDNFDGNYETKLSAFNENASTQTSTFNSVVEQATSDFNSNASTLTETFNTNASEKTSAFNINASEKTQEFNDNVDEKTEQITSQLDNYVQFDNYPSNEKAGVIKPSNNFMVDPSNGYVYAEALDATSYYENTDSSSFISKGTLENIKDDYVGSATPVKNLNTITPKNNAEGTDNTFDDGLESPLFALAGDGKSEQVVTTGKNLLKPTSFDNENISGIVFNTLDNGSISLNGTSTDDIYRTIGKTNLKANTDYVLSVDSDITSNLQIYFNGDVTSSGTNWIPINNNHTVFRVNEDIQDAQINITIKNSTTVNKVFKIQLEENSVLTEYEPYTGGQPSPSPDYEQPINSIEGSLEFACNDNKGSSNQVTFNLNDEKLRSVGDVKDELVVDLDTGDYYKVENIGEVVFDGSENWTISGNTSETNFVGVLNGTSLTDLLKCKLSYGIYSIVNYFTLSSNLSSKQGFQFYNDNGQYYTSLAFSIDIDTVSTIEEFKQWLSTHNTVVDFVLQNPTTKKLGTLSSEDLAKLKTFKGYNNVTINTNLGLMNIRFTYGLDIKKYVDNKLAEISTAMIEEG